MSQLPVWIVSYFLNSLWQVPVLFGGRLAGGAPPQTGWTNHRASLLGSAFTSANRASRLFPCFRGSGDLQSLQWWSSNTRPARQCAGVDCLRAGSYFRRLSSPHTATSIHSCGVYSRNRLVRRTLSLAQQNAHNSPTRCSPCRRRPGSGRRMLALLAKIFHRQCNSGLFAAHSRPGNHGSMAKAGFVARNHGGYALIGRPKNGHRS